MKSFIERLISNNRKLIVLQSISLFFFIFAVLVGIIYKLQEKNPDISKIELIFLFYLLLFFSIVWWILSIPISLISISNLKLNSKNKGIVSTDVPAWISLFYGVTALTGLTFVLFGLPTISSAIIAMFALREQDKLLNEILQDEKEQKEQD